MAAKLPLLPGSTDPSGSLTFDRMKTESAQHWIRHLEMDPHPEGGYYKEVFRSASVVRRPETGIGRAACTSIYYLLEGTDYSGFHRLSSDEIWYYHTGGALHIHWIGPEGLPRVHELSSTPEGNLSVAIPAGTWFAAEIPGKTGFALCSCAVAPGFEFSEFEMGDKETLISAFPEAAAVIERLSR